ncbi:MAG: hypothetical protein QW632_00425 [Ignisphaera sp.]
MKIWCKSTKPEEVIESLKNFLENDTIVFTAVEEANTLGYNVIQFLIGLDIDGVSSYVVFQYTPLADELIPIALIVEFNDALSKEINFNSIAGLVMDSGGFIFGSGEATGILFPLSSIDDVKKALNSVLPTLISKLFNKVVRVVINGYKLDYIQI